MRYDLCQLHWNRHLAQRACVVSPGKSGASGAARGKDATAAPSSARARPTSARFPSSDTGPVYTSRLAQSHAVAAQKVQQQRQLAAREAAWHEHLADMKNKMLQERRKELAALPSVAPPPR